MKKLFELLSTLALIVVLGLTVLLVGVRIIGLTPYCVLSGSMEPAYSVGDLLYVKEVDPAAIEIGMPITFVANERLVIATHRVVDIAERTSVMEPVMLDNGKAAMDKSGKPIMQEIELEEPVRYFLTKGDANDVQDVTSVHENNVIGTPVYALPYVGYFVMLLQNDAGKVMALCFGLMLIILMFLPEMLRAIEKGDRKHGESDSNKEETQEGRAGEDELETANVWGDDVILCENKGGDDDVTVDPAAK